MQKGFRLSVRLSKINPSSTLAITAKVKELKAQGLDVVNLAAGEPDFDTPDFIKAQAIEAIQSGFTKYTPTTGIPELKQSICQKFKKENSLSYDPSQIVVSCGAKHSIFNTLFVLTGPGDEVLIPLPFWVSYPEMVNLCEATCRFINTDFKNNFKMTVKDLKENITPKTRVLILNSPSNPTGCVYSQKELEAIAELCVRESIYVISDEIYEKLLFDGLKHVSIASLGKEIYDLTVTVNGCWRIGYLGASLEIVNAISKVQDHSTSNPTSISQKAGVAALNAPEDFSKSICQEFQKRRDYCVSRLKSIKKIDFSLPQGAFYIFCDISKTGLNSNAFAQLLLNETYVSLIPGRSFGRDDFVRISFATSLQQLEKGFDRIEKWVGQLQKKS